MTKIGFHDLSGLSEEGSIPVTTRLDFAERRPMRYTLPPLLKWIGEYELSA